MLCGVDKVSHSSFKFLYLVICHSLWYYFDVFVCSEVTLGSESLRTTDPDHDTKNSTCNVVDLLHLLTCSLFIQKTFSDALLSANMDSGWCWGQKSGLIRSSHCQHCAVGSEVGEIECSGNKPRNKYCSHRRREWSMFASVNCYLIVCTLTLYNSCITCQKLAYLNDLIIDTHLSV